MSSKRRLRRRQCENKRRFVSQADAVQAIINMKRWGTCRPDTHSYRCPWCGGWHVGRVAQHLNRRQSVKIWEVVR